MNVTFGFFLQRTCSNGYKKTLPLIGLSYSGIVDGKPVVAFSL